MPAQIRYACPCIGICMATAAGKMRGQTCALTCAQTCAHVRMLARANPHTRARMYACTHARTPSRTSAHTRAYTLPTQRSKYVSMHMWLCKSGCSTGLDTFQTMPTRLHTFLSVLQFIPAHMTLRISVYNSTPGSTPTSITCSDTSLHTCISPRARLVSGASNDIDEREAVR